MEGTDDELVTVLDETDYGRKGTQKEKQKKCHLL